MGEPSGLLADTAQSSGASVSAVGLSSMRPAERSRAVPPAPRADADPPALAVVDRRRVGDGEVCDQRHELPREGTPRRLRLRGLRRSLKHLAEVGSAPADQAGDLHL
jgi:hypothetical protein